LISLTHLYVFVQALGILWLLFVSAVSVSATRLGAAWVSSSSTELLANLPFYILKIYVHLSILQVGVGMGKSLWRFGWETYADFPTCKTLLDPKTAAVSRSTRRAQIILLMCPLVVCGVLAAIVGIVQLSLRLSPGDDFRAPLGDPQSRLNRIMRFTVWIGLLQWAQMFQFVFPKWTNAVVQFSKTRKFILGLAFSILVPVSLIRSLQWVVVITPPSNVQLASVLYSLSGVSWDCVLMVSWAVVMFGVARGILGSREFLKLAGWRREAFTDRWVWNEGSTLLKFGYLFACLLIFLRSFLNPLKGFSYGQNDLVVLTVSYPLLMVVIWWSTSSTLVLVKHRLAGLAVIGFGPLSGMICRIAGIRAPGAIAGLWIHLIKIFVKRYRGDVTGPAKAPSPSSRGQEKAMVKSVLQIAVPFTYFYGLLLLILSLLSLLQHRIDIVPPNEYLSVVRPDNRTVAVRHAVSEMQLFLTPDAPLKRRMDPPDLPIYGICGKEFWGLNVIDYGLFSMVSYVGDSKITEQTVKQLFPKNWNISVLDKDGTKDKFWTEFNVNNHTTVIAVRGSEFWRVSDYLEDLRMWTEPVAKSMLTLAFPTVRAWSPKTTAMVFDAYQEFLAFIGIPDDIQYKYQRLLEYIENRNFDLHKQQVVLTGHSLGGGIASIVGAIAKIPTVTFLSPGMYQTASKFFYHSSKHYRQFTELVHNQSISIQVENDFVGKYLDSHAGLVQTITCSVDHLAPLTCHLIDNCICNLVRHCKDPRWPGGCDFRYDFDIFLNATFPEESYHTLRHTLLEPLAKQLNSLFSFGDVTSSKEDNEEL
jgi:lipase ATG15